MKRKCQPEGAWPPLKRCRLHARKQCAYLLVLLRQRRPGEALPRVAPGCGSTKAVRIAAAAWGKDRCGYSLNRSVAGRHGARRALRTEVATLATAFRASRVHWHCSGRHSRASRSRHRCAALPAELCATQGGNDRVLAWLSLAREAQRARGTASEIWPTLANLGGAQRAATLRTEGHSSEIARRTSSSFCLCCAESGPPHEPCTNQLARNGYVYIYVYGYGF